MEDIETLSLNIFLQLCSSNIMWIILKILSTFSHTKTSTKTKHTKSIFNINLWIKW